MRNQALAFGLGVLCAAGLASPAAAQSRPAEPQTPAGFYGGVSLRQAGTESMGVNVGAVGPAWGRLTSPVADDSASRGLFFGGYRWSNDIAVEAAFTTDRYTLRPGDPSARRGVGLSLQPTDAGPRMWNADVFTSWSFLQRFSLYGRLGYAQAADTGAPSLSSLPAADTRRGVNYGVGFRYDVNRSLGLRLEYARFGRFAGETVQSGVLPDSDQVQLGVQLRF